MANSGAASSDVREYLWLLRKGHWTEPRDDCARNLRPWWARAAFRPSVGGLQCPACNSLKYSRCATTASPQTPWSSQR